MSPDHETLLGAFDDEAAAHAHATTLDRGVHPKDRPAYSIDSGAPAGAYPNEETLPPPNAAGPGDGGQPDA